MSLTRLQRRFVLPAVLLAGALANAAPAAANVGETIILRCSNGKSLAGFSQSAYNQALNELSADAEEYGNCSSLIHQAQLASLSSKSGSAGRAAVVEDGTALQATPAEQRSIAKAASAGSAPVALGDQVIKPGVVHVNLASALSSLPGPLLATLAFLTACLVLVAGAYARTRFRGRSRR